MGGGQAPLLKNSEIDGIIERQRKRGTKIDGRVGVELVLVEVTKEKMRKLGKKPGRSDLSFSASSVRNYTTLFKIKLSSKFWTDS